MSRTKRKSEEPTVIKKYANRRLYDTGRSSYVTLDDLCEMVKEGYDFVVYDAKSGDDLTRQVLTQIIVDQESKGQNMLPIPFLRQLIGFYGDNLQSVIPNYLEQSFQNFTKNQEYFREQVNKSIEGMLSPVSSMEEINRQNMAMFNRAFQAFTPFSVGGSDDESADKDQHIEMLKENIEQMQKELERLNAAK